MANGVLGFRQLFGRKNTVGVQPQPLWSGAVEQPTIVRSDQAAPLMLPHESSTGPLAPLSPSDAAPIDGSGDDAPVMPVSAYSGPTSLRVVIREGIYHLEIAPNLVLPMLQGGQPLRSLGDGWNFHALIIIFAPVLLLELRHDEGQRATWFFDCTPGFIGNTVAGLPPPYREIVLHKAAALLRGLLSPLCTTATGTDDAAFQVLFEISEAARLEIGQACSDRVLRPPAILLLANLPDHLVLFPKGAAHPAAIVSRQAVSVALGLDFRERLLLAVSDGQFTWPDVIDGQVQPVTGSLCLDHFSFGYRLEHSASGLIYYLLVSEHNARLLGIYFPSEGVIIVSAEWNRRSVEATFPNLHSWMVSFACRYGDSLIPYLRRNNPKRITGTMRESHLGHLLWNEFSGLEAVLANVSADRLPILLSLGNRASGCFGTLETVFPGFAGKVVTTLTNEREATEWGHLNDLTLVRFTGLFVSAAMRRRIFDCMQADDGFRAARALRARLPGPVIVIGLRVENRTVVGLGGFICRLVDHIARIAPGCTLVLDGQNRRPDHKPVGSFRDSFATRSPIDVEQEICAQAVESAKGKPVTVIGTTGETVASSIAWATAAECFIAIWGAGLAKYRWIANKPGFIISSRYHLLNPAEMSIYQNPRTMEDPTPITYADPAAIEDVPGAEQLIAVDGVRHQSFRVDESMLLPQVTAFLKPLIDCAVSFR